ncbi:MAG TPA: helix-turn-helix transcriptional regulator [Gemmatimonadaceae bacterium]|nr:helix-turn-helix transcriptional regulator [Gemmatimonadaceae bacterium]
MTLTAARPRARAPVGQSNHAGALLRWWREARHRSQLALALDARISPRHLCFIETGRATPSREMIHRLAGVLDIPLRERNALLLAAGYAPAFHEARLDLSDGALAPVRQAIDAMLQQQEPFPAVVMNRYWDVIRTNAAADRLFSFLLRPAAHDDEHPAQPVNVLRLMFRRDGLRPYVRNWSTLAGALLRRVCREAVGGVLDTSLQALFEECRTYAEGEIGWPALDEGAPQLPIIPVVFEKDGRSFSYFSTVSTLGTPQDVGLQDIRLESFFPMDANTRREAEAMVKNSPDLLPSRREP